MQISTIASIDKEKKMILNGKNRSTTSNSLFQPVFISLLILISSTLFAQESNDSVYQKKQWTIDECVNTFNIDDTVGTSVGYQYWFFDKEFIDGRTIKMSVVAPHAATHAPHKHSEDEFFFRAGRNCRVLS